MTVWGAGRMCRPPDWFFYVQEHMDQVIEEMSQRILNWGHRQIPRADWMRWAQHLQDVVQPQLDELEALKAKPAKREKVSA
jgi:hypothetical protein